MCLYVFVSRGCFRHRSALANGFFVAFVSISLFFLLRSFSLSNAFVLSVLYFPTNYNNNSALRWSLSLLKVFPLSYFSDNNSLSCEAKVWKNQLSKVSISTSLTLSSVHTTRLRIRAIKYVLLLWIISSRSVLSFELSLSLLTALVGVFVEGHIRTRKNKIKSLPRWYIRFV